MLFNDFSTHIKGKFYAWSSQNTGSSVVTIDPHAQFEYTIRIFGAVTNGLQYEDRFVCFNGGTITTIVLHNSGSTDLTCVYTEDYKITVPHFKWEMMTIIANILFDVTLT